MNTQRAGLTIYAFSLTLVLVAGWRYRTAVADLPVLEYFLATVLLLLACAAGLAVLAGRLGPLGRRAWALGYSVGALFFIDILAEYGLSLSRPLAAAATGLFFLCVMATVFASGLGAAHEAGSAKTGVQAAVATMLVGIGALIGVGFLATLVAHARLESLLQPESLRSVDRYYYPFTATLEDAVTHLTEAPVLALLVGGLGSVVGSRLGKGSALRVLG